MYVPYLIGKKGFKGTVECGWSMHRRKFGQANGNHNLLVLHTRPADRSTHHLQQAIGNLVELFLSAQLGIPGMLPKVAVVVKVVQVHFCNVSHFNVL